MTIHIKYLVIEYTHAVVMCKPSYACLYADKCVCACAYKFMS